MGRQQTAASREEGESRARRLLYSDRVSPFSRLASEPRALDQEADTMGPYCLSESYSGFGATGYCDKCGRNLENTDYDHQGYNPLPDYGRELIGNLPENSTEQSPWGLPGLDHNNIWWIIPVSCITQLFWCYVGYKLYQLHKRCARHSQKDSDSQ